MTPASSPLIATLPSNTSLLTSPVHSFSMEDHPSPSNTNISMANDLPPIKVRVDDNCISSTSRAQQEEQRLVMEDTLHLLQPITTISPSPDSVSTSSSIASANSVYYNKEQVQAAHVDNKGPPLQNTTIQTEISHQQLLDSGYTSPQQLDQNHPQQQQLQFVYIHHPVAVGTGQMPMSSYYQVYAPPSHSQQPIYVMPVSQPYNMTLQSNIADPNLAFVQITSNQFQQQYVSLPQTIHHPVPPQPISIPPSATTNYGCYAYGGPTQQATAPSQHHQSMTPPLSDVSKQFPVDNIQQQPAV
ncbi:hypothetical protein SESBI_03261 [Sesbania bispinosa]|nr:hypothetical protein SESBI_03261 [Sesbania bispinosa]